MSYYALYPLCLEPRSGQMGPFQTRGVSGPEGHAGLWRTPSDDETVHPV